MMNKLAWIGLAASFGFFSVACVQSESVESDDSAADAQALCNKKAGGGDKSGGDKGGHKGGSGKVKVCHVPPGNPGNAHTIEVGQAAVGAHLAHGDHLGECNDGDDDDDGGDSGGDSGGPVPQACSAVGTICSANSDCCSGGCQDGMCINTSAVCIALDVVATCDVNNPCCAGSSCIYGSCFSSADLTCAAAGTAPAPGQDCCWNLAVGANGTCQ